MTKKKTDKKEIPIKTTLSDLINIGPISIHRGLGKKINKKIAKRLPKKDLRYVFFYLREEMRLIENDFFNAAIISMITMIENCLRNEYYARLSTEILSKEQIDKIETELGLGGLRKQLEQHLSDETNKAIIELNELRKIFIHKNMEEGMKKILTDSKVICSPFLLGGGSIQTREITRSLISFRAHRYTLRVFWLSLKIVKELYPNVEKFDNAQFDDMVQKCLHTDTTLYE